MEEPYAVIPPVRICAGLLSKLSFITINYEEIYGDHCRRTKGPGERRDKPDQRSR